MDMHMLTLFDGMRRHADAYAVFDNRLARGDGPQTYLMPERHLVRDRHAIAQASDPGIFIHQGCYIVSRTQDQKPPSSLRS
jgi:hypothetical protein